jgi:hypothetical protein
MPANVSDDELENLLRDAQKNARKIWLWELFRDAARRPGITPLEELANQLGAAILVDDQSAMWKVFEDLMSLARRHRGSHRPTANDELPLAMMARGILREGLTELGAANKVAARTFVRSDGRAPAQEIQGAQTKVVSRSAYRCCCGCHGKKSPAKKPMTSACVCMMYKTDR